MHPYISLKPKTPDIKTLTAPGSKLQYYRHKKLLFQQDIANSLGIDRTTYIRYEPGRREYCPPGTLQKIATILQVNVTCLLDDYNLFLHRGQTTQIEALREDMGLSLKAFSKLHGIYPDTVRSRESGSNKMSKTLWEKLFQN